MLKHELRGRWSRMLSRCEDDDNPQYHNYGSKGIYVCEEWHDFNTFYEWCVDNGAEKGLQIDRIDNSGPYSPGNCRVVTRRENARNKSNNTNLTAFGDTKCLTDWVDDPRCSVTLSTVAHRIHIGWDVEFAISTPSGLTKYKKKGDKKIMLKDGTVVGTYKGSKRDDGGMTVSAWGESKTLEKWQSDSRCRVTPDDRVTVWRRINRLNWTPERALSTPTGTKPQPNKGKKFEAFG